MGRWVEWGTDTGLLVEGQQFCPPCCHVVPTLYRGEFNTGMIESALWRLEKWGSKASPGFMRPEGIIVWHEAARSYFKQTIERDEEPKAKFKPAHPGQTKGQAGQSAAKPGVDTRSELDKAFDNPHAGHSLEDGLRDWVDP